MASKVITRTLEVVGYGTLFMRTNLLEGVKRVGGSKRRRGVIPTSVDHDMALRAMGLEPGDRFRLKARFGPLPGKGWTKVMPSPEEEEYIQVGAMAICRTGLRQIFDTRRTRDMWLKAEVIK